jgi:hypothetical protein
MSISVEEALLAALKSGNGWLIRHFPYAPEYLQIEAVRTGNRVIRYITNPSPAVQMEAVRKNPKAIRWIRDPHPSVVTFVTANNQQRTARGDDTARASKRARDDDDGDTPAKRARTS